MRRLSIHTALAALAALMVLPGLAYGQHKVIPLGGGDEGFDGLSPVPIGQLKLDVETVDEADGALSVLAVDFKVSDDSPRLLAFSRAVDGLPDDLGRLNFRYRLKLAEGDAPRLAIVFIEETGAYWYKVGKQPVVDRFTDGRTPVTKPLLAAFSDDESGELEWDAVRTIWVGMVVPGKAQGTLEISSLELTDDPYKADFPLPLTEDGAGTWTIGKDPRVTAEVTTPNEAPDGGPCMRVDFTLPGGAHMYMIPAMSIAGKDLEGYSLLQFSYKATVPNGIEGLLIMLGEQGAQWLIDPLPKASEDWTTVAAPLNELKLGGWSTDNNDRLDMDRVNRVMFGTHGIASGEGGPGTIWVTDLELVP